MESLVQGTAEWLAWRSEGLPASELAAIFGESPWTTAYEYWMLKTGRAESNFEPNFATERGTRWEAAVRAQYELVSDLELPPATAVYEPWPVLRCSLDGWNKTAGVVLEIKCAGKDVMDAAKRGQVHPKYLPQVLGQLLCTGAKECHFYVARIDKNESGEFIAETCLHIHKRDEAELAKFLEAVKEFWNVNIKQDIAPPLVERDVLVADDLETIASATALRELKQTISSIEALIIKFNEELSKLEAEYAIGRQEYINHVDEKFAHKNVFCAGVKALQQKNKVWKVTFTEDLDEALSGDPASNQAGVVASNPA